jgi:hypothetical protein
MNNEEFLVLVVSRNKYLHTHKSGFLPASFAGVATASCNRATTAFLLERNHGNLLLGISGDFYKKPGFFRQKRS